VNAIFLSTGLFYETVVKQMNSFYSSLNGSTKLRRSVEH